MELALTASWAAQGRRLLPGALACSVVAAATFLSQHYAAPVMLLALLLGMAMNFLAQEGPCGPGIEVCARTVLRVGVALLGLRITFGQAAALGWGPVGVAAIGVVVTIAVSMLAARALGFQAIFGLLTGGATAICGVSAALALSAALPAHPQKERATLFTVIGISALATLAMVIYPIVVRQFGLSPQLAGIFLGATIHDVAQAVGAGFSLSAETGDAATLVKLMRVALLLPVIVFASLIARARPGADTESGREVRPPMLPGFVIAFVVLVALNSIGWVPKGMQELGGDASKWCLCAAMAGIGMKSQLREAVAMGFKPVALRVGETVFLAALALVSMRCLL